MAPAGHCADAIAKAAAGREPIILKGFDQRRQLDIQFQTPPFGACWLRRTYTNELHRHITDRIRSDDARSQEVRYGNNVAILLKACVSLRRFYNSRDPRDFWSAIARGFGASADAARDMVELLIDARNIYRRSNPDDAAHPPSGANLAADRWQYFLASRGGNLGATDGDAQDSFLAVHTCARRFFTEAEGRQVDLASVLPKETDRQQYSPPYPRKRFASPEPFGRPPSPKRRPDSNYFNRNEPLPPHPSRLLTPLSTGIHLEGSAKQEYRTPISASEQQSAQANSPAQNSPNQATEIFRKIRGTAPQNKNGLSWADGRDSTPHDAMSNGSSDVETQKLRERVGKLEKELSDVKSRQSDDQSHRALVNKILLEHGLIARSGLPSTPNPAVKSMPARIASPEGNAAEGIEHHAQELKGIKESIKIVNEQIASLSNHLIKKGESASSRDQNAPSTLHVLEIVQDRLTSLEDKLLVHGITEIQTNVASLESKVAAIQSQPQEHSVPVIQEVTDRLTRLEDKTRVTSTLQSTDQASTREMHNRALRLEDVVNSLGNRVDIIEAEPDEGEHVRELESRIAVIEHQQDRAKERYATKDLVENTFKQLDARLSQEKDAFAKQLENVDQRLTTTEIQGSKLSRTIDMLKTPKSPSSSHNVQRNVDDIFRIINSLPTEAFVTDMIFKRDQATKSENNKLWRKVDDISTKVNNLPTAASISNMVLDSEQFFKNDVEKLRRDMNDTSTKITSVPNITYISERISHLDQTLRAELERFQKSINALVNGNMTDFKTLQIQVKCLNKLWNEAESKRFDVSGASLNRLQDDKMADLERRVTDLTAQLHTALTEVTPDSLFKRLQEIRSKDSSESVIGDTRVNFLTGDIETLQAKVSILAQALNDMGQLMRPF